MNRHISSRRTIKRVLRAVLGAGAVLATVPALAAEPVTSDAAQVAEGEALYEALCAACHAPDANRIGPAHREVFGSRAGSVDGFSYTPALQSLDVVWDEETLDRWLAAPAAMAPGTSMGVNVPDPDRRRALIAFLRSLSVAGR
ncbi:c-type cytochrome [Pyruvatibacter mobilis]|jgi:cytochrome c|uniref:c-type cytochrome n=1 Tax=Pyruvatibacter mobilis TaxID=1712261 RepID=UPI003BAAEDF8